MKISVDVKGLDATKAYLAGMGKQVAFAASKALNATGKKVSDVMPEEIERALDRPTPFTKKGVRVLKYANKANLETTVGFMAAQAKYMAYQVEGGTRQPGPGGLKLPAAIKLNEFGNIPKGVISQLIAVARKENGLKKATSKRVKVSTKVDLFYGDPTDHKGKVLPRGIYKIVNGALIPLIVFPQNPAQYRARFDFAGKAKVVVDREWQRQFDAALDDALRTAK
jgi:hypothetical protein